MARGATFRTVADVQQVLAGARTVERMNLQPGYVPGPPDVPTSGPHSVTIQVTADAAIDGAWPARFAYRNADLSSTSYPWWYGESCVAVGLNLQDLVENLYYKGELIGFLEDGDNAGYAVVLVVDPPATTATTPTAVVHAYVTGTATTGGVTVMTARKLKATGSGPGSTADDDGPIDYGDVRAYDGATIFPTGTRVQIWQRTPGGTSYWAVPDGPASATLPGYVSELAQHFKGDKTFDDTVHLDEDDNTGVALSLGGGVTAGCYFGVPSEFPLVVVGSDAGGDRWGAAIQGQLYLVEDKDSEVGSGNDAGVYSLGGVFWTRESSDRSRDELTQITPIVTTGSVDPGLLVTIQSDTSDPGTLLLVGSGGDNSHAYGIGTSDVGIKRGIWDTLPDGTVVKGGIVTAKGTASGIRTSIGFPAASTPYAFLQTDPAGTTWGSFGPPNVPSLVGVVISVDTDGAGAVSNFGWTLGPDVFFKWFPTNPAGTILYNTGSGWSQLAAPTTDGTYLIKLVVTGGVGALSYDTPGGAGLLVAADDLADVANPVTALLNLNGQPLATPQTVTGAWSNGSAGASLIAALNAAFGTFLTDSTTP